MIRASDRPDVDVEWRPSLPTIVCLFLAAAALIMLAVVVAARVFDLIVRLMIWLAELVVWAVEKYRDRPRHPTIEQRRALAELRSLQAEQAAGLAFGPDGRLL